MKLLISILLVSFVGISIYTAKDSFRLQVIEVNVINPIESKTSQALVELIRAELSQVKGQWIWEVSIKDLNTKIQKYSGVESLRFSRKWPSTLQVQLSILPIVAILDKKQSMVSVFTDGKTVLDNQPDPSKNAESLVILRGQELVKNQELRLRAIKLLDYLNKQKILNRENISDISFEKGFLIQVIKPSISVFIGDQDEEKRLSRVVQVLEHLEKNKITAKSIDATLSKKVLVRR
jgi:cell division septal protein FtsQ